MVEIGHQRDLIIGVTTTEDFIVALAHQQIARTRHKGTEGHDSVAKIEVDGEGVQGVSDNYILAEGIDFARSITRAMYSACGLSLFVFNTKGW